MPFYAECSKLQVQSTINNHRPPLMKQLVLTILFIFTHSNAPGDVSGPQIIDSVSGTNLGDIVLSKGTGNVVLLQ